MKTYNQGQFVKKYSRNEFNKILKLHGHEKLPDTKVTLHSTYELGGDCLSSCSNCSGISCCRITVNFSTQQ